MDYTGVGSDRFDCILSSFFFLTADYLNGFSWELWSD